MVARCALGSRWPGARRSALSLTSDSDFRARALPARPFPVYRTELPFSRILSAERTSRNLRGDVIAVSRRSSGPSSLPTSSSRVRMFYRLVEFLPRVRVSIRPTPKPKIECLVPSRLLPFLPRVFEVRRGKSPRRHLSIAPYFEISRPGCRWSRYADDHRFRGSATCLPRARRFR